MCISFSTTLILIVLIVALGIYVINNIDKRKYNIIKTDVVSKKITLEDKKKIFHDSIETSAPNSNSKLKIMVNRKNLLENSLKTVMKIPSDKFFNSLIRISFENEIGCDMGGLFKEWITLLVKELTDPKFLHFEYIADEMCKLVPTRLNLDSEYYVFLGRLIAKALVKEITLELNLETIIFKKILGLQCNENDYKRADKAFYETLTNLRSLNESELEACELTFVNHLGKEIVGQGKDVKVKTCNLEQYIFLILEDKYDIAMDNQCGLIRTGLFDSIPLKVSLPFNEHDLEALVCGEKDIDVKDWKNNTIYRGFGADDEVISWFWKVVEGFTFLEKSKLLHFTTGSNRVPFGGFKNISGWKDKGIFKIQRLSAPINSLPTASTCVNQLNLPNFSSLKMIENRIRYAIIECSEGFSLL